MYSSDNKKSKQNTLTLQEELSHAAEEMYKKNVELNERNKTLSLLRKIDLIILSTVTDTRQIAQQVSDAVVSESDIKGIVVYELSTNISLVPLADAYTGANNKILYSDEIPLSHNDNILVRSVSDRKPYLVPSLSDTILSLDKKQNLKEMQASLGINTVISIPLIVRNSVIGLIVLMLDQSYNTLPDSQKRIIERISGVIGIALDNALLYRAIQNANEKLKELDKLKDEFVSLASHELRTPMTVIKSYVWLLLEGKMGDINVKQKEYLQKTFFSTNRLIDMVNDMLNISRIESGRLVVEPKLTDIYVLLKETVDEMLPKATESGINLMLEAPHSIIPKIYFDPDRIKQVMINLIGNSLKFTPNGGTITVAVNVDPQFITTTVKDTGRGIKPEDMEKLFKKFNMLGNNYLSKPSSQGTGLGLYLSKALIELHRGRIWVESSGEGKGSTFAFTLPLVQQQPEVRQVVAQPISVEAEKKVETNTTLPHLPNLQA